MDLLARAGKDNSAFDTARYRRQSLFMKGASQLTPGCGGTSVQLAPVVFPLQIRPYEPADWPAVWALLEPVFRAGETFTHDPAITEAEAQLSWVEQSQAVMVAVDAAGAVVGTSLHEAQLPLHLPRVSAGCRAPPEASRSLTGTGI
jgi:hypothetical protein